MRVISVVRCLLHKLIGHVIVYLTAGFNTFTKDLRRTRQSARNDTASISICRYCVGMLKNR